jgi:hypothetical protein
MKHSRIVTGLLAVALTSLMVSNALGQGRRGGGPGGPGGPGGRGGPGGGFGGFGDPIFGLLRVEEVKTEIELMPDQDEAIQKLNERGRDRGQDRDRPNFREMSEDERREAFEKMRKEGEERTQEMREQLEQVLLPPQMERLEQISIQVQGVRALRNERVAKQLKITDEQMEKMAEVQEEIGQEMRAKMQELFQSNDRDGMREALGKMREESEKKILGVLSTSQQKQFEEMKGEKFDMPDQGRGGFFTGRGGGPGGPGGPGGAGRGGRGGRGGGPGGPGARGGQRSRPPVEE